MAQHTANTVNNQSYYLIVLLLDIIRFILAVGLSATFNNEWSYITISLQRLKDTTIVKKKLAIVSLYNTVVNFKAIHQLEIVISNCSCFIAHAERRGNAAGMHVLTRDYLGLVILCPQNNVTGMGKLFV